jgi:hypothetical protein
MNKINRSYFVKVDNLDCCVYGGYCSKKPEVYLTFKERDLAFGVCAGHINEYTKIVYVEVTLDEALVIEVMRT